MAEEIVALVRRLHSHPSWAPLINHHISESLQQVSHLVASPSELGVGAGTVGQKVSGWYRLVLLEEASLQVYIDLSHTLSPLCVWSSLGWCQLKRCRRVGRSWLCWL